MTDTLLVRLKPYDPRRGHVLRRYTYAGIKFQEERGWYRVERPVAEYLRAVREFLPIATRRSRSTSAPKPKPRRSTLARARQPRSSAARRTT